MIYDEKFENEREFDLMLNICRPQDPPLFAAILSLGAWNGAVHPLMTFSYWPTCLNVHIYVHICSFVYIGEIQIKKGQMRNRLGTFLRFQIEEVVTLKGVA